MTGAAILIVSDTCSKDPSQDATGPALAAVLPITSEIFYVADESSEIRSKVRKLCSTFSLVIASGGTGFAPRDVTPEAVSSLIDKPAPGLVTAMLVAGLKSTPLAALARPVAGTIGDSLVFTVPGSPKGALESVYAIIEVIPHALKLLSGESSRSLHSSSAGSATSAASSAGPASAGSANSASAGLSAGSASTTETKSTESKHTKSKSAPEIPLPQKKTCSHGNNPYATPSHGHKPLTLYGPSQRPRESPFPMIPFPEALQIVLDHTPKPTPSSVSLMDSLHHVLSEDVHAPLNVPPFRASIVDGYAVMHSDCPGTLPVSHVLTAAADIPTFVTGTCVRITTGAPVPHGATAVVPVENTTVAEEKDGQEIKITISADNVQSGDNIRDIGSDLALGELVLPRGTPITPVGGEVGVLASIGLSSVPTFQRPVVGVLSTGDEVVSVTAACSGSQIWDSNRPMLLTALQSMGIETVDLGIAEDTPETLRERLVEGIEKCDILVTSGGVSMGELDLLKPMIQQLGGTIHFGRVAMKPGKPVTFATLGSRKLIFALPGNPASAGVCLNLFVLPCIDTWSGMDWKARRVKVRIEAAVTLDPRPEFHRVHVDVTAAGLVARSTGFQRSSRVKSMVNANGFLCLPPKTSETSSLPAGSMVDAILL